MDGRHRACIVAPRQNQAGWFRCRGETSDHRWRSIEAVTANRPWSLAVAGLFLRGITAVWPLQLVAEGASRLFGSAAMVISPLRSRWLARYVFAVMSWPSWTKSSKSPFPERNQSPVEFAASSPAALASPTLGSTGDEDRVAGQAGVGSRVKIGSLGCEVVLLRSPERR